MPGRQEMLGFWKHFKGGEYHVIDVVECCETLKKLVIYQDVEGRRWARPLENWEDHISRDDYEGPRFRRA